MSSLQEGLNEIEREIHTLETATPRNSATVNRGGLSVVDEGSLIVEAGGTVFFDEGGSAVSSGFSLIEGTGWQIGTERRGSSVVVLNDTPGYDLEVTTADSTAVYEEIVVPTGESAQVALGGASSVIVQVFHTTADKGSLVIGETPVSGVHVIKSQKDQWVYSYMGTYATDVVISTDMEEVIVRLLRLTVNNVA